MPPRKKSTIPEISANGLLVLKYPEQAVLGVYIWIRNEEASQ
ncbi:MAG: hypothetical protein ACOYMS_12525 [Terrimicrobiaceae bacterium]